MRGQRCSMPPLGRSTALSTSVEKLVDVRACARPVVSGGKCRSPSPPLVEVARPVVIVVVRSKGASRRLSRYAKFRARMALDVDKCAAAILRLHRGEPR